VQDLPIRGKIKQSQSVTGTVYPKRNRKRKQNTT